MEDEANIERLLNMIVFMREQTEPSTGYWRTCDFTVDVPQRTMGIGQAGEYSVLFELSLSKLKMMIVLGIDADILYYHPDRVKKRKLHTSRRRRTRPS
jgi:hypothetical protein